ncbi:outer membrane beta-barrel protein [Ekhidna sp.]|uniref:outer membrane beta-barrel protein n=1 Tax=Ekhidna sp. TaxID=2608089 RepID=UPI003B5BE9E8
MRKILLTFCFLATLTSLAQELRINASGLISDKYYFESREEFAFDRDYKPKPSYSIGLSYAPRVEKLSLIFGLHYARIRAKHNLMDDGLFNGSQFGPDPTISPVDNEWQTEDLVLNLDYLYLSTQYVFALSDNWFFSAGPQIGYLINSLRESHSETPEGYNDVEISNKFDLGVLIGLEVRLSNKFGLLTNFYNGFGKVEPNGFADDLHYSRNRYLSLGLSYLLTQ